MGLHKNQLIVLVLLLQGACSSTPIKPYTVDNPKLKAGKYLDYYWYDKKYKTKLNNPIIKLNSILVENHTDIDVEDIESYKIWIAEHIQEKSQSIVMKRIYGEEFYDDNENNKKELYFRHLKNAKKYPYYSREYLLYRYGNFNAQNLLWQNIPSLEYDAELEIKIIEISYGSETKRRLLGPFDKSNKAFIRVQGQLVYKEEIIAMFDNYEDATCYEDFSLVDHLIIDTPGITACINDFLIKISSNIVDEITETLLVNK